MWPNRIETRDAQLIRLLLYRESEESMAILKDEIRGMLENGIVESSTSEWSAPVVLVLKRIEPNDFVWIIEGSARTQPLTTVYCLVSTS